MTAIIFYYCVLKLKRSMKEQSSSPFSSLTFFSPIRSQSMIFVWVQVILITIIYVNSLSFMPNCYAANSNFVHHKMH